MPAPDPSPEEIRTLCLKIQERWSPSERRRRAGAYAEAERVEFPVIRDRDNDIDFLAVVEHTDRH